MTISRKTKLSLAIASALTVTSVHAQEASNTLEEVVVTARKKEESLQDIPLSVTAMTGQAMRQTWRISLWSCTIPGEYFFG